MPQEGVEQLSNDDRLAKLNMTFTGLELPLGILPGTVLKLIKLFNSIERKAFLDYIAGLCDAPKFLVLSE